jgi:SAM-dependent methyltransferase
MTSFDEASMTSGYARYLAAKTTVDDRALNGHVLAQLRRLMPAGAPRVLEVGAGLGTMVARLMDWGVVATGEYILLDADRQLLDDSRQWLRDWAATRGLRSDLRPDGLQVGDLRVRLVHAELGRYLEAGQGALADVLIANAVLDLVDVPAVLPGLLRLLIPGGVYWFTINYDGESIFEPTPTTTRSCRPTTATWMSAFATAGRPVKAERAAACSTTCGMRGRPCWRRGRRTGSSAPARMGTTQAMRLTSCAASLTRSRTRCGAARIGWNRQTWPAGWPCVVGNWLRVSWSTSPTSLISRAAPG